VGVQRAAAAFRSTRRRRRATPGFAPVSGWPDLYAPLEALPGAKSGFVSGTTLGRRDSLPRVAVAPSQPISGRYRAGRPNPVSGAGLIRTRPVGAQRLRSFDSAPTGAGPRRARLPAGQVQTIGLRSRPSSEAPAPPQGHVAYPMPTARRPSPVGAVVAALQSGPDPDAAGRRAEHSFKEFSAAAGSGFPRCRVPAPNPNRRARPTGPPLRGYSGNSPRAA